MLRTLRDDYQDFNDLIKGELLTTFIKLWVLRRDIKNLQKQSILTEKTYFAPAFIKSIVVGGQRIKLGFDLLYFSEDITTHLHE